MAIPKSTPVPMSWDEYLAAETRSTVRHEFRDGRMVAMAGGTYEHSLVITNILGELRQRLRGTRCRVLESNMRVQNQRRMEGAYPDAVIVCGEPEFGSGGKDRTTILNPRVIVEVPSPSSTAFDQNGKFDWYCEIESFEEYIHVFTNDYYIVTHLRTPDGQWKLDRAVGIDKTLSVSCLGLQIPVRDIYEGLTLPPSQ